MATDDLFDRVIIFAVAQKPFDTPSGSGVVNTFCTLRPVLLEGGERARPEQFPNNGLVWWKLLASSRADAVPGTLLGGYIEHAVQYSPADPNKQRYQVVPADITPVSPDDVIEIYNVGDRAVAVARDLVNTAGVLELDHPPSDLALVRWRSELYGPLATRVAASGGGAYRVSLAAPAADGVVLRMPDARGTEGHLLLGDVRVSLDDRPPPRSAMVRSVSYELLTPAALDRLQARPVERLVLLRDDELIARAARYVLTRTQRQRLTALLDELKDAIAEDEGARSLGVDDVIAAVRRRVAAASPAVASLADALLDTDALREPLRSAIERAARKHIDEQAAVLRAEIEASVATEAAKLDELRRERQDIEAELAARHDQALRDTRAAVDAAWRAHQQGVEQELGRIAAERERLEMQGRELSDRLGGIAARFGQEHDRLLGDLMLLLPVLQRSGAPVVRTETDRASGVAADATAVQQRALELPPWVALGAAGDRPPPAEAEFIDRFVELCVGSRLGYTLDELLAFHVAQKCADLLLVSGPPGTARSALARMYARALAGETSEPRWLSVPVEATWLDLSDVIGRVDPQTRTFDPATGGVFALLVAAAAEHERHGDGAGLSTVSFDGFDRATPDHYLAALLHALDQPGGERRLPCFDPLAVRADSPLAALHTISLPPTLRIVGVLDEDENARPVSAALYDRAPLIRVAGNHEDLWRDPMATTVSGAAVTLGAFRRWQRDAPLSLTARAILDTMRTSLRGSAAEPSPRAFRTLTRFVTASVGVMDPTTALDMQIEQHVARLPVGLSERDVARIGELERGLEPWLEQLPRTSAALVAHKQDNDDAF
jgi:hypothetical protein